MNVKEYKSPQSCNLPYSQIADLAEKIAREMNLTSGADLQPFVELLGGRIQYDSTDPWEDESGSIVIESVGSFQIVLPQHTSTTRDRFTIAHELGHYFLHFALANNDTNSSTPMRAQRFGSGLVEIEANIFAASFLMPEEEFKEMYEKFDGHKLLLADHFKVSLSAAAVREKVLDLAR